MALLGVVVAGAGLVLAAGRSGHAVAFAGRRLFAPHMVPGGRLVLPGPVGPFFVGPPDAADHVRALALLVFLGSVAAAAAVGAVALYRTRAFASWGGRLRGLRRSRR
ncbi:MAG: hypothetical protein ACREOE_02195 [Gemmatimonadales bacterium]